MRDEDTQIIPLFSFVPAQPDWCVALFIPGFETSPPRFELEPIIAWKIDHVRYDSSARHKSTDRHHHVDPITVEGDMEICGNDWVIKRPDGKYQWPWDQTFDNEADALKYLQSAHEQEQERLAKLKLAGSK